MAERLAIDLGVRIRDSRVPPAPRSCRRRRRSSPRSDQLRDPRASPLTRDARIHARVARHACVSTRYQLLLSESHQPKLHSAEENGRRQLLPPRSPSTRRNGVEEGASSLSLLQRTMDRGGCRAKIKSWIILALSRGFFKACDLSRDHYAPSVIR